MHPTSYVQFSLLVEKLVKNLIEKMGLREHLAERPIFDKQAESSIECGLTIETGPECKILNYCLINVTISF